MLPATLRDRLRDVISAGTCSQHPPHEEAANPEPLEDVLGGRWRDHNAGRSFVVSRRFPPDRSHGRHRIGELSECVRIAPAIASLVLPDLTDGPLLFFDIETTGLSGGAGTRAFLVGCGWFDPDGAFVTEQHLMTDHAGERSMLGALSVDLRCAGGLVTFNGKSFDSPVIETRYLFHRLDPPCANKAHLDMLHVARRFWGGMRDAGCSLGALEAEVLDVRRSGDVSGFEIPARYFHFVRSRDPRPLATVFEHNRLDLVSLAALTARFFHLVESGPNRAANAREALALGRIYERARLPERAAEAFERAVDASGPDAMESVVKAQALRGLAVMARRERHYELAATQWRRLFEIADCPPTLLSEAMEALAIHHEHRARDLAEARTFAVRRLEVGDHPSRIRAARHRLARIERKLVGGRAGPVLVWD